MHYIGSMGWSYEHWVDNFYSPQAKPRDYLQEYSRQFKSVEINSTFYRIPSRTMVENWRRQTPKDFRFAAKFPQAVTHAAQLGGDAGKLEAFLNVISLLGDKLGALLVQLPPSFKEERYQELVGFLSTLPEGHRIAVEFRHKSWFQEKVYDALREFNVALVLFDHPWLPELDVETADFAYIRWQGDRKKVNGEKGKIELDRSQEYIHWARKVSNLQMVDVYGYFSKFYSGHPPTDILRLVAAVTSASS